ncbi:MAG: hypothetical protein C0425_10425 [Chlorobiaceae bacterium]|nr:hypothetical protein [Chlorobiaceae bacterium]MBA4310732.1 hypothetical protein [Chlorobiaceae bacterium]
MSGGIFFSKQIFKIFLLVYFLFITFGISITTSAQTIRGTLHQRSFIGSVTRDTVLFNIYLPQGYESSVRRYPVVYHLHGLGGNQGGQQNITIPALYEQAADSGYISQVIIVFPNGYVNTMWANSANSNKPAETNIISELIPHIDSIYRTFPNRENRIMQGFSMGGFGAAKFITKFPNLFSKTYIIDGALLNWSGFQRSHPDLAQEIFNNSDSLFSIYSPWNFITQNHNQLRNTIAIYSGVGSLLTYNRAFRDSLQRYFFPFGYAETGCGHALRCVTDATGLSAIRYLVTRSPITAIEEDEMNQKSFEMINIYPNPFNPSTTIRFSLSKNEKINLRVFDLIGRVIATLVDEELSAGEHLINFDGKNFPSGVYFIRLKIGSSLFTHKAMLLK